MYFRSFSVKVIQVHTGGRLSLNHATASDDPLDRLRIVTVDAFGRLSPKARNRDRESTLRRGASRCRDGLTPHGGRRRLIKKEESMAEVDPIQALRDLTRKRFIELATEMQPKTRRALKELFDGVISQLEVLQNTLKKAQAGNVQSSTRKKTQSR